MPVTALRPVPPWGPCHGGDRPALEKRKPRLGVRGFLLSKRGGKAARFLNRSADFGKGSKEMDGASVPRQLF
jgi:hypothetical protein